MKCEECGIECKKADNLSRHIGLKHNKEIYYEKYLKHNNDGICIICKKPIKSFKKLSFKLQAKTCSKECQEILHSQTIKTFSEDKIKNANEKRKKTCLEKYGHDNPVKNEKIREKMEKTCLLKYGVSNYFLTETHANSLMERTFSRKYFDDILYYESTYELDFLQKYISKIHIENGKVFKYKFKNALKRYYSDFYIPLLNLIVEIKSSYYYKKELGQNIQKRKSVINQGYNFIFIIDKKYKKMEEHAERIL